MKKSDLKDLTKADIDAKIADQPLSKIIKSVINPNLVGAV